MSTYDQQYEAVVNSNIDLQYLRKVETYNKNDVYWFFSSKDKNWELSNMAGGMPIFFENHRFHSSEQLYQASKYQSDVLCTPEDKIETPGYIKNVRERILASKAARGSKMTQKCAVKAGLVREDWDDSDFEIRIHSMLWVLELKLFHNRLTFAQVLQNTASMDIVEVSRKDSFWGCFQKDGVLQGCNVLGKLLMQVRHNSGEIKRGNFSYPFGFLLD